jgi:2,3-bisphosphoglycerate-independent phosphoglycerate mutase
LHADVLNPPADDATLVPIRLRPDRGKVDSRGGNREQGVDLSLGEPPLHADTDPTTRLLYHLSPRRSTQDGYGVRLRPGKKRALIEHGGSPGPEPFHRRLRLRSHRICKPSDGYGEKTTAVQRLILVGVDRGGAGRSPRRSGRPQGGCATAKPLDCPPVHSIIPPPLKHVNRMTSSEARKDGTESMPGRGGSRRARVALVILDGWGLRDPSSDNAVTLADTPVWDSLWIDGNFPRARLTTHGPAVGLPEGQMGNSEVGHLNLGAGRVVTQSLQRISQAIESGEFFENPELVRAMRDVSERGATLHLMGLIGPGGVHAVDSHLLAICEMAMHHGVPRIRVHAFLDGRDTPPQSARDYLTELLGRSGGGTGCRVATVMGRYWSMDRDKRWDRTEKAYRAIVYGDGIRVRDPVAAIQAAYDSSETDEFISPRVMVDETGEPVGRLRDGDSVLFFNFRADRVRQITRALAEPDFIHFDRGQDHPAVGVVTLTQYDADFPLAVAFPPQNMTNILADVLADSGRTSFRTAETEKYPHVTYFFNGGVEKPRRGESRQLVPSPKVATYDLQPEMSAEGVADVLIAAIHKGAYDLLVCNFANPDMVGHTGVLEAAIRAVETVDVQLGRVVDSCRETGTTLLVTADHGNCEQMWDPTTDGPHTAHTTNPVGIILVEPEGGRTATDLVDGALCDVAPTILGLLQLDQPDEMTGRDLRRNASLGSAEIAIERDLPSAASPADEIRPG